MIIRNTFLVLLSCSFALSSCKRIFPSQSETEGTFQVAKKPSDDYERMFSYSRALLTRPNVQTFLKEIFKDELAVPEENRTYSSAPEKLKEFTVTQFMTLLQHNVEHWKTIDELAGAVARFDAANPEGNALRLKWRKMVRDLVKKKGVGETFKRLNSPLEPLVLSHNDGSPGYKNPLLYTNYTSIKEGRALPPSDLKKVWMDFIRGAKTSLVLNVFDFDLMEVAELLVEKANEGVDVRVGIDVGVIKERDSVRLVHEFLSTPRKDMKGSLRVFAVSSVGLNHQKMAARDYASKQDAAVLFSSGNLTQSCIGPEGDLKGYATKSQFSIPNANHVVTMDSYLLAQVVSNQLTMTLDMGLRGQQYPLGGVFRVFGEDGASKIDIAFSPQGAFGDVNRDIISRALATTTGPVRMLQFAFSAKTIENALLERARVELEKTGTFDFKSVGDTPFAMREWSVFLSMSGYALDIQSKVKKYVRIPASPWELLFHGKKYAAFTDSIRGAPRVFGNHKVVTENGKVDVSSKIHHKVLITGDQAIVGTSFNFSEGALSNNEQILVFTDPRIVAASKDMFAGLYRDATTSVSAIAEQRNRYSEAEPLSNDSEARIAEQSHQAP